MKKILILTIIICFFGINTSLAEENLAQKLTGKILLQTEENGEAWYLNPGDYKKYFLNRPKDAFNIMRKLGIGITNNNLNKIPIGIAETSNINDDDNDGLANNLEIAIGTNKNKKDTDDDGFDDKSEIENNFNPLGAGELNFDLNFTEEHLGKIFLAVENNGEAWYLNPGDEKRYYLGRPSDAFSVMQFLSLGITNNDLNKILTGIIDSNTEIIPQIQEVIINNKNASDTIAGAAEAIRDGDIDKVLNYFTPRMEAALKYTLDFLDSDGRLTLGNILSGSNLLEESETKVTFENEVYFSLGGYEVPLKFYVEKQNDETWKLTNL